MKAKNKVVEEAKKEAKIALGIAKKDAKEALAIAKAKFEKAHKDIDKQIESHPEQAVLVAATLGAAVGALATYGVLKRKKK
jgi:ElaB/YqjD/DUF883 family membrane-anchored ribosome-binding protein